jgi:hypothetical protein
MPRYDGTGPQGAGPRTGRGMGRCRSPAEPVYGSSVWRGTRAWIGGGEPRRSSQTPRQSGEDSDDHDTTSPDNERSAKTCLEALLKELDRVMGLFYLGKQRTQ